MSKYEISNRISGQTLGTYIGETCWEALDEMARDAGYRDYLQAFQETGTYDDLIVSKLPEEVEEEDDFPFDRKTRVEITDDQIDRLLITSVYQGDHDLVLTCLAALDGSERHRADCCRVIAAAKEIED